MYDLPILAALAAMGRLSCVTNLLASPLISITLFNSAKAGANGKAATKIVTNPNCNTKIEIYYQYFTRILSDLQENKFLNCIFINREYLRHY